MIQPTLINLHPNEYSREFHYYRSPVKLDRCLRSCNTCNDLRKTKGNKRSEKQEKKKKGRNRSGKQIKVTKSSGERICALNKKFLLKT